MNPIARKHAASEDLKRLIGTGVVFAGGIGLLWAVLYWRNDIKFAAGIVLIHILFGAVLSLCVAGLANVARAKMNLTGILGFFLGVFWVSPILLLHKIKTHYYVYLDADTKGLLMIAILVLGVALFGFLGGYFLGRLNRLAGIFFVIVFSLIVPVYSALTSPMTSQSEFNIVNRLNEKQMNVQPQTRVMVFGIDGGTWSVIVPLLEQGKLPNLRALMENGQYGILTSLKGNTLSPVVWTSIFTGKLPQNHGITKWVFSDSRNRFSKSLWNILNDYGQKAVTVNIPGTFPPEKILGVQISGFPIPSVTEAEDHVVQQYGRLYTTENRSLKVVPVTQIEVKPSENRLSIADSYSPPYESRIPIAESMRTEYATYRLRLANLLLEYLDERGIFQTPKQQAVLPVLVADTTDDGTVNYDTLYVFPNESGKEPVAVVKENQWSDWIRLVIGGAETQLKLKLLALSKDRIEVYATPLFQSSFSPKIPFTYPPGVSSELSKEIGQYVVQGVGWKIFKDEIALDLLYEHIVDVSNQQVRASEYILKTFPDWELFVHLFTESDRIMHAYWKYFQPEYYQSVDGNLVRMHGGKINSIIEKVDADIGKLLAYADKNTTIVVVSDHGFQASPKKGEGGHNAEGIYIFSGKGIKNSDEPLPLDIESFPEASLLGVTPTILYLMGYPVGKDMDGEVMSNVLEGEKLKCCPVRFVDSYEGDSLEKGTAKQTIDESTENQLRSLGYIE